MARSSTANLAAASLAAQVAEQAAQQEYLRMKLSQVDVPGLELQKDQLAFQKATEVWNQAFKEASLTGMYQGKPTTEWLAAQAGITGYFNGAPTLAREDMESQRAVSLLNLAAQLRGPRNAFQFAKVLGNTPQGLRDILAAAAGRFNLAGFGGQQGAQPQAASLQNFVGDVMAQAGPGSPGGVQSPPQAAGGATGQPQAGKPYPYHNSPTGENGGPGGWYDSSGKFISDAGVNFPPDVPGQEVPHYEAAGAQGPGWYGSRGVFIPGSPGAVPAVGAGYGGAATAPVAATPPPVSSFAFGAPPAVATAEPALASSMAATVSPPGVQAPTDAWNWQPNPDGSTNVFPPGATAPAGATQVSTAGPATSEQLAQLNAQALASTQYMPPPNQVNARNYGNMIPYQQDLLWAAYENAGYDPQAAQDVFKKSLPAYAAPLQGTVKL